MRFDSTKAAPSNLPAFYEWKAPGQTFSIQLSYDVIDRLQADVMKGFWAVPKRGAEVGGVLLGRVVGNTALTGGEAAVFIEDYELVSCEHRRGPSFVLSEPDRKRLERALRRNGGGLQAVGYVRSHTRPGLYLDEDDMAVVRPYFSSPLDVVLLIRPQASRKSAAGFFFWEAEDMRRHSTYKEFPFDREELAEPVVETQPVQAVEVEAAPATPEPAAPAPGVPVRRPWKPFAYAAAVIAGVGLIEYQILGIEGSRSGRRAEAVADLRVERKGTYLQVSWDRSRPAVAGAQRAVLSISDGNHRKELHLDAADLRDGSIAYSPSGNDVSFRLELEDGERRAAEAVRVVTAPPVEPLRKVANETPAPPPVRQVARPRTDEPPANLAVKKRPRARPKFFDDGL